MLQKRKFQTRSATNIENLPDKLYYLENKQAKGGKLCANIRWELEDEKCLK